MRFQKLREYSGYTFFEVIAVIVLIGIFTTVAIVQHAKTDPSLIVQAQVLQSHIRYAQMRSMNSDVRWGIQYHYYTLPADERYYDLYVGNPNNIATLPGESHKRVRLGHMGITINSSTDGNPPSSAQDFQLSFDSWGQPYMDGSLATDPIKLNLSKAGHSPEKLNITPHTGFIP